MCGIVASVRKESSAEEVFLGLRELEYRGYDSWGIATRGKTLTVVKQVGKISDAHVESLQPLFGDASIGHTRWATHGGVTEENAHPHLSQDGSIAVVHNGIIENADELKEEILKESRLTENDLFRSETDTEVIPHLLSLFLKHGKSFEEAFVETMKKIEGRFTVVAMSTRHPGVFGARDGSPLVVGVCEEGMMLSSDTQALLPFTKRVNILSDREYVAIYPDHFVIKTLDGGKRIPESLEILTENKEKVTKEGHPHFMLKEILEENETIDRALHQREEDVVRAAALLRGKELYLTGCGTAGRMAVYGQYIFAREGLTAHAFVGSEYALYRESLGKKSALIVVSQSGETADVLEAIRDAKRRGVKVLAILNAEGSSIERYADATLFIHAGPERAVASTKAATGQMTLLALLAFALTGKLKEGKRLLRKDADTIARWNLKDLSFEMKHIAEIFQKEEHTYIIGRGIHAPIAEESAIKIQEVAYLHAEGFAGGELKHGPLALVTEGTKCIAFLPSDETTKDTLGNIAELKARGAYVLVISPLPHRLSDEWVKVPHLSALGPVASLIPIQLLAYHLGVLRGNNPDMPRNLAKSVTVK